MLFLLMINLSIGLFAEDQINNSIFCKKKKNKAGLLFIKKNGIRKSKGMKSEMIVCIYVHNSIKTTCLYHSISLFFYWLDARK